MPYSRQNLYDFLLVVVLLIIAVGGRPQYYETNEIEQIQPGQTYNPFFTYPALNRHPDIQNEKLRYFIEEQQDQKDDAVPGGGAENILRDAMTKRQAVRYRQCYFNPISCFRK